MAERKEKAASLGRRIIGDILLTLAGLLTLDVIVVMACRIRSVVLKTDHQPGSLPRKERSGVCPIVPHSTRVCS